MRNHGRQRAAKDTRPYRRDAQPKRKLAWAVILNRPVIAIFSLLLLLAGCRTLPPPAAVRTGEEIIVAGQYFPTGTRVVTWHEPGGYNAYQPVLAPDGSVRPKNHGLRRLDPAGPEPAEPPDLAGLRGLVDQFVLHYDTLGLSGRCFDILQNRGLSVHFLLDVDGTVYQTLDLQERAWHATIANNRSIGIEIANLGAYPVGEKNPFAVWYVPDEAGGVRLSPPLEKNRIRTPDFVGRPARAEPVTGTVQGKELVQYDFTPEQYAALIKLTAALHRVLPKIRLDYPCDADGALLLETMTEEQWVEFGGVIGHFHIQDNKVDPGPALQWDKVIEGARSLQ